MEHLTVELPEGVRYPEPAYLVWLAMKQYPHNIEQQAIALENAMEHKSRRYQMAMAAEWMYQVLRGS